MLGSKQVKANQKLPTRFLVNLVDATKPTTRFLKTYVVDFVPTTKCNKNLMANLLFYSNYQGMGRTMP